MLFTSVQRRIGRSVIYNNVVISRTFALIDSVQNAVLFVVCWNYYQRLASHALNFTLLKHHFFVEEEVLSIHFNVVVALITECSQLDQQ